MYHVWHRRLTPSLAALAAQVRPRPVVPHQQEAKHGKRAAGCPHLELDAVIKLSALVTKSQGSPLSWKKQ